MKMCCLFAVIQMLTLEILLVGFTNFGTASRYDYGHHPSAEEFDHLLSGTRHTWTHSLLKAERNRSLMRPAERRSDAIDNRAKTEAGYLFVPKFHYEINESKRHNNIMKNPSENHQFTDFDYYSHELPQPLSRPGLNKHETFVRKPTIDQMATKPIAAAVPEFSLKPIAKPDAQSSTEYSTNLQTHFPIYFTNPASGTIYAITEMGKSAQSLPKTNATIPIFITKEQYERDITLLKNEYKKKCQNSQTVISTASTTSRPQIIRLYTPLSHPQHTPISKLHPDTAAPSFGKKPSSIIVKTELTVKDKKPSAVTRPTRIKNKKTKHKRKIKKQKSPGHKRLSSTVKPFLNVEPDGPVIILGSRINTRNAYEEKENISTQVEKPNFDNIFSSAVVPHQSSQQHKIIKRSLDPESLKRQTSSQTKISSRNLSWEAPSGNSVKSHNKDLNKTNSLKTNLFSMATVSSDMGKKDSMYSSGTYKEFWFKMLHNPANAIVQETFSNPLKQTEKYFTNLRKNLQNKGAQNKSDFKNEMWNTKLFLFNLTRTKREKFAKQNLQNVPTNRSDSKNPLFNTLFNENPKHRINKRSSMNLTNPSSALPKFVKKPNEREMIGQNKTDNKTLEKQRIVKQQMGLSINSTQMMRNNNLKPKSNKLIKHLKKRKTLTKMKSSKNFVKDSNSSFPRLKKMPGKRKTNKSKQSEKIKKIEQKSKRKHDTGSYFYEEGESYEDDDDEEYEYEDDNNDDDDDKKEEEEVQDYKDANEVNAYNDYHYQDEVTSASAEEFSEKPAAETHFLPEIEPESAAVRPALVYDTGFKTKHDKLSETKKRIRRRPPQLKSHEEYDDDDDDDGEDDSSSVSSNLGEFFRMIFYPIQVVMSTVMDSFSGKDADEKADELHFNPYTEYTSYHNSLKQHSNDEYDEDYDSNESTESSLSSWFRSWFTFNRRNKKIGSTTVAPIKTSPTKSSAWLPSWLGFGANDKTHEDYDEYDKWFASWFGEMKPKKRRRSTTTTSTTTQIPHVPILTIVDPMRNPQNWIGILAHHLINHTGTSTSNPLKDIWNKVSTTTTENPEAPRRISYDKYQIWRLKPQDVTQVKALEEYKKSEDGIKLQWLKGPSLRGLTDVLVPPKMVVDFQAALTFDLVDHEVLIFDVGKAIAYEKNKEDYFFSTTHKPQKHRNKNPALASGMTWRKYYEYDDIIKYLETMRMRFPHLVELIHIGRSYEGRPLIVMKIESKEAAAVNSVGYPAHQRNKLRHRKRIGLANAVFIEAGTHGMEWIGPATATWIINELLRIMKKNVSDDQSFIRNTTWYVMPVLNPDGYVYTHEFDRFWKKSRSRHVSRPSGILNSAITWLKKKRAKEKICFGVDLDRNWHYQWGRRGSSRSACNEFYAGPTPFSEPETKALSEFLMDYRTQIKLFVSMQAYGQIISYPYKANTTYDSERLDDLLDVAMVGTDGLRKKGSNSRYKIDSSNDLIENRSGCSDAFAAYEVGIPFSYTLQLADNGVHGYLLPSASIESTAKDSFEIITGMLDYI